MESVQVQCPVCGAFGEAGSFCEMGCGRLPKPASSPVASVPVQPVAAARAPMVPRIEATVPTQFVEGSAELVVFAYEFSEDVFERLELSVKDGDSLLGEARTERRPGCRGELRLNVQPSRGGHLALTVELTCLMDEENEGLVYRGRLEAAVKPRPSNVTVNTGPISISGNYGNDFAGANIGGVTINGESFSPTKTVPFKQTLSVLLVRKPSRLLLTRPEETVQIFARERISLGRRRENDVILRVFDHAGQELAKNSLRLSGTHARLIVGRTGVELYDGGERPSTNGTFVDGCLLAPGGCTTKRSGTFEIGFGPGTDPLKLGVTVHSDDFGRTVGCVIRRSDGAKRRTLLLVREVPLDAQGTSLSWDGGVFTVLTPIGARVTLLPGMEVEFEGRRWRVKPYRPTWVHDVNG